MVGPTVVQIWSCSPRICANLVLENFSFFGASVLLDCATRHIDKLAFEGYKTWPVRSTRIGRFGFEGKFGVHMVIVFVLIPDISVPSWLIKRGVEIEVEPCLNEVLYE